MARVTVQRYVRNWYALRAARIALYKLAIAGSVTAVDAVRMIVLHAGIFAICSVHNTVHNQETQFGEWLNGRPIRGLSYHVNAARSVGSWLTGSFDISLLADRSGMMFVDSAIAISGLGPAKSTFMGALMGFDNCPCIDVHMARMHNLPKQYANLTKYRAAVDASPFTCTLDQWRAFLIVPKFAADQHDIYFNAVLPIARAAISAHAIAMPALLRAAISGRNIALPVSPMMAAKP